MSERIIHTYNTTPILPLTATFAGGGAVDAGKRERGERIMHGPVFPCRHDCDSSLNFNYSEWAVVSLMPREVSCSTTHSKFVVLATMAAHLAATVSLNAALQMNW